MKLLSFNQPPVVPAVENKKSLAEEFTKEEIVNGLAMPDKNIFIDNNIIFNELHSEEMSTFGFPLVFSDDLLKAKLTLLQKESKEARFVGAMVLYFGELADGQRTLFIAERELLNKKEGLGLDLECQIENFCKKHEIRYIYNQAASDSEKGIEYVGAYVWAKYGYEFADESQIENLRKKFYYFAIKQGVIITTFLENLKRPIDFALAKGVSRDGGEEVEIGKQFLLNTELQWFGKRDLTPGSQGTKDFIAYLKKRGREDLIDKYYADEK